MKQLTAPEVLRLTEQYERMMGFWNEHPMPLNRATHTSLNRLFSTLEWFEPARDENGYMRWSMWIGVERGTLEDYADPVRSIENEEYECLEEIVSCWNEEYPNPICLISLSAGHDTKNGTRVLVLNRKVIMNIQDDCRPSELPYALDMTPLLDFLTGSILRVKERVERGTYRDFVLSSISDHQKTGIISAKDWWEFCDPEGREELFSTLDEEKIRQFMKTASEDPCGIGRLPRMTAELYFEACRTGYLSSGHGNDEQSGRQMYMEFSDGRHEGLINLPEHDSQAFEDWWCNDFHRGSHPWEILRGGSTTHVGLYLRKDRTGWYFEVAGVSVLRSSEAMNIYLALLNAGYPVVIRDAALLKQRLTGEEAIGIVPADVFPRYCQSLFPGRRIETFVNLPWDADENMMSCIEWQDPLDGRTPSPARKHP